ncbi:MAG: tetratricopeptide repeat protein [Polyangiales bacterium]
MRRRGHLRRAIVYYEEALRAAPEDASLYLAVGDVHRRLGEHDEAATAFARSLEQATEHGDIEMIEMAAKAQASLRDDERRSE